MDYRTHFLLTLAHAFLLPPLLTSLILRSLHTYPSTFHPFLLHLPIPFLAVLSIPLTLTLRTLLTSRRHAIAARRLGALPIPVVRGTWPGNVDILKRLLHGWRNGYINESLREFFEEYQSPTINVRILWVDQIWTMDPNHMKHILVSGFQHFDKGAPQRERMQGFLGTGIFASDGEMWKMHRAMTRPFLAKSRTSDIALFARHAEDAITHLERLAAASGDTASALDIQDLSQRYTLDVALDSFFGIGEVGTMRDEFARPHVLDVGGESKKEDKSKKDEDNAQKLNEANLATSRHAIKAFAHAMEHAADTTILRARQGVLWPLFEFRTDKIAPHARTMRRWVDAVMGGVKAQEREREQARRSERGGSLREREERSEEVGEGETFVEHLVRSTDDDTIIRDQLINMVLGARDTTAALLTFAVYFLAMHEEVYTKLRAEVMELCPLGESLPEVERVREFGYLRAVLNETLRVFPSVPINTRYSTTESVFPPAAFPNSSSTTSKTTPAPRYYTSPLYMPPHTSISLLPLLMHRRTDLWGPDAEEFRPERWVGKGGNGKGEESNEETATGTGVGPRRPEWFIPFSAGPRLCPGQSFAYLEASYFLIMLVQRGFVFRLAPQCQPLGTRPPEVWKVGGNARVEGGGGKGAGVFVSGKGRQVKEECWPGTAFTLYSKGGLWAYVGKVRE